MPQRSDAETREHIGLIRELNDATRDPVDGVTLNEINVRLKLIWSDIEEMHDEMRDEMAAIKALIGVAAVGGAPAQAEDPAKE